MTITNDSSAPLIVVVGATGTQGGSVIKALAESSEPYRIRGLTRDASKKSAMELKEKGVEMASVTLTVEYKDEVARMFEGATYAFVVTNFWEHLSKEREINDGKMILTAAASHHPKLIIWSGLEDFTSLSNQKYTHVDHFDGKAAVTAHGRTLGVSFANVEAGMYMSNFLTMAGPKKVGDGKYALFGPVSAESKTCLIDTENDYGLFVREAIESPRGQQQDAGSEVLACGDVLSFGEIAKQLSEVTGKNVTYMQASEEDFIKGATSAGLPEVAAKEMLEMYQAIAEFGYYGPKDPSASLQYLTKKPRTWKEYVTANKHKFEEAMSG